MPNIWLQVIAPDSMALLGVGSQAGVVGINQPEMAYSRIYTHVRTIKVSCALTNRLLWPPVAQNLV
jgi:hypothetical protein